MSTLIIHEPYFVLFTLHIPFTRLSWFIGDAPSRLLFDLRKCGSNISSSYRLTFTNGPVAGKRMIVQSTNTGSDISNNQFDILMPGGGVGLFNGCASQWGGIPGAQYGGVGSRGECDGMPDHLKAGCYWRFDWFLNADNPTFDFKQVACPAELADKTGCRRSDDGNFPAA